jgi:hypothetical protein
MYYKTINNEKYDSKLLEYADVLTKNKGDGRISKQDIYSLFENVKDANVITEIEQNTLLYIRNHYNLTPLALEVFDYEMFKLQIKIQKNESS